MSSWAAENIDLPEYDRCVDPCHLVALFHPLLPWTSHLHTHPGSITFVYLENEETLPCQVPPYVEVRHVVVA